MFVPKNLSTAIDASAGWEGLKGQTVCINEGYYLNTFFTDLGINLLYISANLTSDEQNAEIQANVESGACIGTIDDNSRSTIDGYPQAGLKPLAPEPYGIAVALGNDNLRAALSAASVAMMDQGMNSSILQLEKEWVVPAGVPANKDLQLVVKAISNFTSVMGDSDGMGKEAISAAAAATTSISWAAFLALCALIVAI